MRQHIVAACAAWLLCGWGNAIAAEDIGSIKTLQGKAHIVRAGTMTAAQPGLRLQAGDHLLSYADSAVGISLRDSTLLTAGENAEIQIQRYAYDPVTQRGHLDVLVERGSLAVVSGQIAKHNPDAVRFRTPTLRLGVRGTEFVIDVKSAQD